jgi:hypothetical protein
VTGATVFHAEIIAGLLFLVKFFQKKNISISRLYPWSTISPLPQVAHPNPGSRLWNLVHGYRHGTLSQKPKSKARAPRSASRVGWLFEAGERFTRI